jgi:hypothetical protein
MKLKLKMVKRKMPFVFDTEGWRITILLVVSFGSVLVFKNFLAFIIAYSLLMLCNYLIADVFPPVYYHYKILGEITLTENGIISEDEEIEFNSKDITLTGDYYQHATLNYHDMKHTGVWEVNTQEKTFGFLISNANEHLQFVEILKNWYIITAKLNERHKSGQATFLTTGNFTFDEISKLKNKN